MAKLVLTRALCVSPLQQLDAMQGRLQELSKRQGAREEEAARRLREAEERFKASNAALQAAHTDHQVRNDAPRDWSQKFTYEQVAWCACCETPSVSASL